MPVFSKVEIKDVVHVDHDEILWPPVDVQPGHFDPTSEVVIPPVERQKVTNLKED